MKITSCKVNHLSSPLGFELTRPVFSWKVREAAGKMQTSAHLTVCDAAGNVLFDKEGNLSSLGTEADIALAPRTVYTWKVSVTSDAGETAESDIQCFETAKMDEPWQAKWIGCGDAPRHPVYSRKIEAAPEAVSARLYITGLGLYEAFWSGKRIGDEYLTPYCTNYNAWLQYQTFDVTEEVKEGGELSVMLGNGWYKGRFGFSGKQEGWYGDSFKLLAELVITYADGQECVIGTDETWEKTDSSITFSNIYDGECIDETLPATEPVKAELCEAPKGALVARYSLPVRVFEEIAPAEILHTPAGETVVDFGQNMSGLFRLRIREKRGTVIHLQAGEVLQGGNFYRDNLRSAKAEYTCITDGTDHEIVPHFTFFGFRYMKVEGIADLKAEDITALAITSQMDRTGFLVTGHDKVNRLIKNAEWGHLDNFVDVPTDCPQRDERMGWTGDAEVFAPTATLQRDTYAFYRKFMHDVWTEQLENEGMVPNVVPKFDVDGCACAWGDVATIIPWNMYKFYGDTRILEEQFDSMKAWVDYISRLEADNHAWRDQFHFGDWLALDGIGGIDGVIGGTDSGFIALVYYLYSTRIVAEAARVLGNEEDAEKYGALANEILAGINEEYYSPAGRCCIDTQTGQLLTLRHGLGPNTKRAGERLVQKLAEYDNHLVTGFVGTPILAEELTKIGREDLSYELLLREEYPGWLYEVNLGATTIWERWNSMLADGSVSSTGMNSFNHYAYGSIVQWIYERAAGLKQSADSVGYRKMDIAPRVNWYLKKVDGTYDSPAGEWKSSWEILDETHIKVSVTVPFNCTATLRLPCADEKAFADTTNPIVADVREGVIFLGAGTYEISYETSAPLHTVYGVDTPIKELLGHAATRKYLADNFPQLAELPPQLAIMSIREVLSMRGKVDETLLAAINTGLASV